MAPLSWLLLLGLASASVSALSLPPYFTPCKTDSSLDECAIKIGNAGWATAVKGDPKYRTPVLDPLDVKELVINSKSSKQVELSLTLKDSKISGLRDMKITESKIDLKNKHIEWTMTIPLLTIVGDYDIKGKFLVLPIQGKGPANITFTDMKMKVSFDYTLEKKKGDDYFKMGNTQIEYDTSRMYARFEDLFNGDKQLSDNMNLVIDENWQEFNKEMNSSIGKAFASVFKVIFSSIMELVPYKEVFAS